MGLGIPVLTAIAYGVHELLPPIARFHERHGSMFHGLFRMLYFVLAGIYLGDALRDTTSTKDQLATAAALVVTGAVLSWQQQRGTKAQRLPLLFLLVVGIPAISYLISMGMAGDLQVGGWLVTAGFVIALVADVRNLAGAQRIMHGG